LVLNEESITAIVIGLENEESKTAIVICVE
jgi:hypothetical protein